MAARHGSQTLCAAERRTMCSGYAQQRIAAAKAGLDADLLHFDQHIEFDQHTRGSVKGTT